MDSFGFWRVVSPTPDQVFQSDMPIAQPKRIMSAATWLNQINSRGPAIAIMYVFWVWKLDFLMLPPAIVHAEVWLDPTVHCSGKLPSLKVKQSLFLHY